MRMGMSVVTPLTVLLAGCAADSSRSARVTAPAGPIAVRNPEFLEQWAATRRFSAGHPSSITVAPDATAVLYLRSGPRSFVQDLYEYDIRSGRERVLLTAERILQGADEKLSAEELARRERMRVSSRGIVSYELSRDGRTILVPLSGRLFVVDRESAEVVELSSDRGFPVDPRFSPDGKYVACVRENELFVIHAGSGEERRLTTGSSKTVTNGLAEFVAQEEMDRREGYWWAPDSSSLVYQQTSTEGVEVLHIHDATHPEKEPHAWPYPRAGKKNADVRLGIVPVRGGETRWITWDVERYPYLATVRWSENAPLTVLVQNREQTEEALLSIDAESGYVRDILLVERDDAWLNLDSAMPKWFSDGSKFLWTTERQGSWQLELRDRTGTLLHAVTPPTFSYRGFVVLDEARHQVIVAGSENPTENHLYRVPLVPPGAAPVKISSERGLHGAVYGENREVFVHTSDLADGRRLFTVRDRGGRSLGALPSVAEEPPSMPQPEWLTVGRNPEFHAVLLRPRDFKPGRKYPVLLSVYGGPGVQTVVATARRYLLAQWLADHGFIVVSIDGRGTPGRGRSWERVIRGNVIDLPLKDQVSGLRALAEIRPELDLNRVGIYGWSFGGYFSAMGVMREPDVFRAGVAGAPVADWLDYDTHYTERYMGLPEKNVEGYRRASVLAHAAELRRPLLIIHGTTDDNVYFLHSLKMSDALFRAGRPHGFLPLSGFTHMVADPNVTVQLQTRIVSFFQEYLRADAR
jgi:dipeptidyl-peptidase-4